MAPPISRTSASPGEARNASTYASISARSSSAITATAYFAMLCPSVRRCCLGRERDRARGFCRSWSEMLAIGHDTERREMPKVETKNRATSSEESRKQVLAKCKTEGIESMLLWFNDLEGHLKSFAITPGELEGALDDGMGFDGSSITGFNAIEESDMVAIPDPETFVVLPWRSGESKVGRMICDVVTPDGHPYEGDPRYVLRRALERMQDMGFDTFNVGPELEYFLFKDSTGTETLDEGGYFAMTTQDAATELRNETILALEAVGIPIEYHHHEVGPSQHEIDMRFANALDMADHTLTYRLIVKEIAAKNGVYATFMPKPIFGENGSGMHTHQSLFTDGRNAFFDGDDQWNP